MAGNLGKGQKRVATLSRGEKRTQIWGKKGLLVGVGIYNEKEDEKGAWPMREPGVREGKTL